MPTPTHAGGVVMRSAGADTLYLIVTALGKPNEWTLPKGHINPGETPEDAAVREIREEAGVAGEISCLIGMSEFSAKGEQANVNYYLINYLQSISDPEPNRQIAWC